MTGDDKNIPDISTAGHVTDIVTALFGKPMRAIPLSLAAFIGVLTVGHTLGSVVFLSGFALAVVPVVAFAVGGPSDTAIKTRPVQWCEKWGGAVSACLTLAISGAVFYATHMAGVQKSVQQETSGTDGTRSYACSMTLDEVQSLRRSFDGRRTQEIALRETLAKRCGFPAPGQPR